MRVLVLLASLHAAATSACSEGRVRYEPRSFLGYACVDDCERHKAGFAWAERALPSDVEGCGRLPRPEGEGCRAWLDERLAAEEAGYRWALENEITDARLCDGGGERFRAGCERQLLGSGQEIPR